MGEVVVMSVTTVLVVENVDVSVSVSVAASTVVVCERVVVGAAASKKVVVVVASLTVLVEAGASLKIVLVSVATIIVESTNVVALGEMVAKRVDVLNESGTCVVLE